MWRISLKDKAAGFYPDDYGFESYIRFHSLDQLNNAKGI